MTKRIGKEGCSGTVRAKASRYGDEVRAMAAALLLGCGAASAQAQFTHPSCTETLAENQFKYVPLVGKTSSTQTRALAVDNSLSEPIHMALDSKPNNQVDVYFTERKGAVKKYDPVAKTVTVIGEVAVSSSGEMGLTGIALDPAFKTNKWMYLFYASGSELRLSRFTLTDAGTFSASTEKRLLTYRKVSNSHMGGALAFDSNGDLLITSGNDASDYPNAYDENTENRSTEGSSANLADLRGGLMRIHPDNSAKGYTIPAGNFAQYWSNRFRAKGDTALANEYANPAKVLPELYVKGARNAYSVAVDPVRHWIGMGNFGINVTTSFSESHYLFTRPAFIGYPYFAGGFGTEPGANFYALWSGAGAGQFNTAHPGLTESVNGPVNDSKWNKGPRQLPPVMAGMHTYLRGTVGGGSVTGPFLHYDAASTSQVKFPPHFEGAWAVTDWVQNDRSAATPSTGGFAGVKFFKLSAAGDKLVDSLKWFRNFGMTGVLDMQQGPDGALYVLNYGNTYFGTMAETKLARIEYSGPCRPTVSALPRSPGKAMVSFTGTGFTLDREGSYTLRVATPQGRILKRFPAQSGRRFYAFGDLAPVETPRGVLMVTVSGAAGSETFPVYRD